MTSRSHVRLMASSNDPEQDLKRFTTLNISGSVGGLRARHVLIRGPWDAQRLWLNERSFESIQPPWVRWPPKTSWGKKKDASSSRGERGTSNAKTGVRVPRRVKSHFSGTKLTESMYSSTAERLAADQQVGGANPPVDYGLSLLGPKNNGKDNVAQSGQRVGVMSRKLIPKILWDSRRFLVRIQALSMPY